MEKLRCQIVKNEFVSPLHCKAVLCWDGATFADGSTCTPEIMEQIVQSVDFATFAPPLCIQHEWDAESAVGKMTNLYIEGDKLFADFDVMDAEAQTKIQSGLWDSVSVAFESPSYSLIEVSLVALPAIPGAKITPAETSEVSENAEAEEEVKEEEGAEGETKPDEKPAETSDEPSVEPEVKEDEPEEKKVVSNEFSVLKNSYKHLQAKYQTVVNSLQTVRNEFEQYKQTVQNERKQSRVTCLLNEWVEKGYTLPASLEAENTLLMGMSDEQIDLYATLKCTKTVHNGRRLSAVNNDPNQTREANFLEGFKQFLASNKTLSKGDK